MTEASFSIKSSLGSVRIMLKRWIASRNLYSILEPMGTTTKPASVARLPAFEGAAAPIHSGTDGPDPPMYRLRRFSAWAVCPCLATLSHPVLPY